MYIPPKNLWLRPCTQHSQPIANERHRRT